MNVKLPTSQKFWLTALIIICATVAFIMKAVDQSTWADLIKWALGIFVGGNVTAKLARGVIGFAEAKKMNGTGNAS